MQNNATIRLLVLFLSLTLNLFSIEGRVKVLIADSSTIYTSQKVTVSIEILSDALSITDTKILFPPSPKYIVQAPKSASYINSVEINDTAWQMVHYDYDVYALQAGKIAIAPLDISFTSSMGYGQAKKEFVLKSDTLSFEVASPKGIKANQFVLVTQSYTLETSMKHAKKQLIIGDAIELEIVQKAQGVPDVLLTPIGYDSSALLRVYPKEPILLSGQKGKHDVSRRDRFTFVASGEGNITVPTKKILWWNAISKKVEVETIPAFSFEILPDPQIAIDAKKAKQKVILLTVLSIVFLLLIFYKLFNAKVRAYFKERKRVYLLSEAGKFTTLRTSLKNDDASTIYTHLYSWIFSISPTLSRGGFASIIKLQPSFESALNELENKVIDSDFKFNSIAFSKELNVLREGLLEKKKREERALILGINPC